MPLLLLFRFGEVKQFNKKALCLELLKDSKAGSFPGNASGWSE